MAGRMDDRAGQVAPLRGYGLKHRERLQGLENAPRALIGLLQEALLGKRVPLKRRPWSIMATPHGSEPGPPGAQMAGSASSIEFPAGSRT